MAANGEEAITIIERCFAAIAALDADRLVDNYVEDYRLELPYYKPGEPMIVEGREVARSYLKALFEYQRMNIRLTKTNWIAEEQLMIAEYESDGDFLDTGELYQNSYVGFWFFEGDRVRCLREYYNPQAPRASALDR